MNYIDVAKQYIEEAETSDDYLTLGAVHAQIATAYALVAIAEELKKINERAETEKVKHTIQGNQK